jgi:rhodanese-related sulfurtransferase
MLSDQFKLDCYNHFPLSFSGIKPIFLLLSLAICFAAFSMDAAAEQAKTELKAGSHSGQFGTGSTELSASTSGQLGRDSRKEEASYDCTTIAGKETGETKPVQNRSLIERLDQTRQIATFSCLENSTEVYGQWSRDKVLLIDVRKSSEYERYRIPGSLNLAPFSIKSKAFLKDKNIVLVNEGQSLTQLEKLCNQLESQGFKSVGVMAGGLYAWYQSRYPITGDNLAISKLKQITPAELLAALDERDWRFIDLDNSLPVLADLLLSSEAIDYQSNKNAFISSVNKAVREFNGNYLSGFIVVSEKGDNYKAIERLFRLTDAGSVFYLSGGITELKRYLSTHSTQVSRLARGFKEPHRCGG